MDFKLISENWKKFLNEDQARIDPGLGGGGMGPLTWNEIRKECERVWTAQRIQACYFKSVRGLPSISQIIKMVSKDKDILATLSAVESGDVDVEFKYKAPKWSTTQIFGSKETDFKRETSTARVVTIYLDPGVIMYIQNQTAKIFYDLEVGVQKWNARYHKHIEDSNNRLIKRYGSEALEYLAQGAITRGRLDNFINLWGFTILLRHAGVFVHELAHVFDPDNVSNLAGNQEELNKFIHGDTVSDSSRKQLSRSLQFIRGLKKFFKADWKNEAEANRKKAEIAKNAWQKFKDSMSGRSEMFATNRSLDFIADLEDSELLKLAYNPSAGGPTNLSASGVNLENFSLMSAVTPPPTKNDISRDIQDKSTVARILKSMNNRYQNLLYGVIEDNGVAGKVISAMVQLQESYSKHCSKRLHMMSKDIQLDIYGVASGDSDDRLAPDSYEDRKLITRTARSSNREKGIDESKKRIKINII